VAECTCPEVNERPWEPPRKVLSVRCEAHGETAKRNAELVQAEFRARQARLRGKRRG
jgi:hypothetical protein